MAGPIYTVTSDDTLTLFGRVFNNFADGDNSMIVFNNDRAKMKTGKNKNTIFAKDESGNNANLTLRLMKGSDDDQFLQTFLSQSDADFVSTQLASGQFVKRLGDGQGNSLREVYTLQGGIFTRQVDGKENVNGDTNQGVAVYNMMFASAARIMQ